MRKIKVIHVRVDGAGSQQQIENFEKLVTDFMASLPTGADRGLRTFVTPMGQTSSVYMTAIIDYSEPAPWLTKAVA